MDPAPETLAARERDEMIYFKCLEIVLGILITVSSVFVLCFQKKIARLFPAFYPPERPRWFMGAGTVTILWILWTWIEFFRAPAMEHFVVTLIVSLALVKIMPLWIFYKKSRELLGVLFGETTAFRAVFLCSLAIGAGLLIMALFFK